MIYRFQKIVLIERMQVVAILLKTVTVADFPKKNNFFRVVIRKIVLILNTTSYLFLDHF